MFLWLLITSTLLYFLQAFPQQEAEQPEFSEREQQFIDYITEQFVDLANHKVPRAVIVFDKVIDELGTPYAENVAVQKLILELKSFSAKVKASNKQNTRISPMFSFYIYYDRLSRKLNVTWLDSPSEADHIVYDSGGRTIVSK